MTQTTLSAGLCSREATIRSFMYTSSLFACFIMAFNDIHSEKVKDDATLRVHWLDITMVDGQSESMVIRHCHEDPPEPLFSLTAEQNRTTQLSNYPSMPEESISMFNNLG